MQVPEKYRIKQGQLASDSSYGNNGFFVIPHHRISNYFFQCQVSDGMEWDHVSVSLIKTEVIKKGPVKQKVIKMVERCPTWEEMCFIKSLFWDEEDPVMQLHPPKSEWINNHPYCLHLWRPQKETIPLPLKIMVGHEKLNQKENATA